MPPTTDDPPAAGTPLWRQLVDGLGLGSVAVAVVLALVVGIAAYGVAGTRQPSYVASAATLLDQPGALAASQDAGVVDKLSRLRLKYAGILRSDAVVDNVARELDLPRGAVAGSIVTTSDVGSLLLFVGARASTRGQALRLANALARALAAYVTQEQAGLAARDRLSLRTVAPARNAVQLLPTRRQQGIAGLGGGLVALVLVLGVADLLRRRRA